MKKFILAFLVVAVAIIIYLILANINNPSSPFSEKEKNGALSKLLGRPVNVAPSQTPKGDVLYNGKYASFKYPASAKIYSYRQPGFNNDKSTLEYFSFDISSPRLVFNLSVATTFLKSINDYPGIKLRQTEPSVYTQKNIIVGSNEGLVFERNDDQPEKTVFFLINGKIYTFSITGTSFEEINGLFNKIFSTLKLI